MYRKNPAANKAYLSTSLINQLQTTDDDNDEFYLGRRLNDTYKSLSQLKFDKSAHLYIDYYTCQEYNKKVTFFYI